VGCLPAGSETAAVPPSLCIRQSGSLLGLARQMRAEEIVTAISNRRQILPMDDLLECRLKGFQVTDFSSFIEHHEAHVEIDGLKPSWMIYGTGAAPGPIGQRFAKRILDVACSLTLMAFSAPLAFLVALAILVESRGPVLYRQKRVGLNGKQFTIWKFRSMATDAEAEGQARWARDDDPRVTHVGRLLRRLRLDELPQIWNVLIGDMSFVGPRPERPEFVASLEKEIPYYSYRHTVTPGISGWAQIHYPYGNTIEDAIEKLKYDLYYVKNYSLVLDFIVLIQTLRVIIYPSAATNPKAEVLARVRPAE
jgi:sugar transferase (PEP-CTERM system associated)